MFWKLIVSEEHIARAVCSKNTTYWQNYCPRWSCDGVDSEIVHIVKENGDVQDISICTWGIIRDIRSSHDRTCSRNMVKKLAIERVTVGNI